MVGTAALVAVAIGAYVAKNYIDDTQSKIAALEKQSRDREAQQKREEEERKRNQPPPVEVPPPPIEKVPTQPPTQRAQPDTKKSPNNKSSPALVPPREPAPDASQKSPAQKGPAQSTPAPKQETPEPPKESQPPPTAATPAPDTEPKKRPPTTDEQLANAEHAINDKRYADASAILRPLAEAGNAVAEERIGDLYAEGRGVPRDAGAAEHWYEQAGLQGATNAQLKLGSMYANGNGIARNNNVAYMWYGIAASLGSSTGKTERDKVGSLLQPAEREKADEIITEKIKGMKKL